MSLKDYIHGNRRGKEANRLEREAMNDPFLQKALEGFETVTGNHSKIVGRLEKRFSNPAVAAHRKKKNVFLFWPVAASVLLVIGLCAYFLLNESVIAADSFGEKEFQTYCRQKANKNVCNGNDAWVKVSFFINETGKPAKIEYENYSCEDAKKEMDNMFSSSPAWTSTNRNVTMTIKW